LFFLKLVLPFYYIFISGTQAIFFSM